MKACCESCGMMLHQEEPHLEVVCRIVTAARELRAKAGVLGRSSNLLSLELERLGNALDDADTLTADPDDTDPGRAAGVFQDDAEGALEAWDQASERTLSPLLDLEDLRRMVQREQNIKPEG